MGDQGIKYGVTSTTPSVEIFMGGENSLIFNDDGNRWKVVIEDGKLGVKEVDNKNQIIEKTAQETYETTMKKLVSDYDTRLMAAKRALENAEKVKKPVYEGRDPVKYSNDKTFEIKMRKFNTSRIGPDKTVLIMGRRATGKSWLVKDIMYQHSNIPIGTVISGTESANLEYSKMVPSSAIHEKYTPEIIKNVVNRQKKATRRNWPNPGCFLIMDDCLYDNSWTKDVNIRQIFMNGRHWKTLNIMTTQDPGMGIPPNLRTNIDYVFILRENYLANRKRIYESYAGMFPTFEIFCKVMDACTDDYNCLVIDNNARSHKLEDQVFYYKAEDHGDFRVGCKEWWKHTSQMKEMKKQKDHELLIEALQYTGVGDPPKLNFNHPINEILKGRTDPAPRKAYSDLVDKPYIQNTKVPATGVYTYTFPLKPEDHQPTGGCNYSFPAPPTKCSPAATKVCPIGELVDENPVQEEDWNIVEDDDDDDDDSVDETTSLLKKQVDISPWNMTTIAADPNRKPLDL